MSGLHQPLSQAFQQRWRQYQQRFALATDNDFAAPANDLALSIIIPCYDEPEVMNTLECLYRCDRPACAVEVLLIINASEADDEAVHRQNQKTYAEVSEWAALHNASDFNLHVLIKSDVPTKHRGVGYARKLGFDLAVSRFAMADQENGICLSLDADCLVEANYLTAVFNHFTSHTNDPIAVINFAHRVDELDDDIHKQAMAAYECHLRYYVLGIRYAGLPYDYHTLGSCFAVTAQAYMAQGGMNKRQGGEDFYFIHKFTALNLCSRVDTTRVFPSARLSQRIPFGTGPTLSRWLEKEAGSFTSYHPQAFTDLRHLACWVEALDGESDSFNIDALPDLMQTFLIEQGIDQRLAEIQENTASIVALRVRFWRWFDAFLALKYIHFAHRDAYQRLPVIEALQKIVPECVGQFVDAEDLMALLLLLRVKDEEKT